MPVPSRIAAISLQLQSHLQEAFHPPGWDGSPPVVADVSSARVPGESDALLVFLYHLAQSAALRHDAVPNRVADPDPGLARSPPLALDLHYMISAHAAQAATAQAILETACQRLYAFPLLDASAGGLDGPLACVPVAHSPGEWVAIWQGIGMPLVPALAYRVSARIGMEHA